MSEREEAVVLANAVLNRYSDDPDDNLGVLSRQFLRALEREESLRTALAEAQRERRGEGGR